MRLSSLYVVLLLSDVFMLPNLPDFTKKSPVKVRKIKIKNFQGRVNVAEIYGKLHSKVKMHLEPIETPTIEASELYKIRTIRQTQERDWGDVCRRDQYGIPISVYADAKYDTGSCTYVSELFEGAHCYILMTINNTMIKEVGTYKKVGQPNLWSCDTPSRPARKLSAIPRIITTTEKPYYTVPFPNATEKTTVTDPTISKITESSTTSTPIITSTFSSNVKFISLNQSRNQSESSNNFKYVFKETDAYEPIKDQFSDTEYIYKTASHGLQFLRTGRLYKFTDFFTHYWRLPAPIIDTLPVEQFKDNLIEFCESFYINHWSTAFTGVYHVNSVLKLNAKNHCKDLIGKVYEDSSKDLDELLQARYKKFQSTNLRKKRFIFASALLLTAGAGLAAGFFLGKGNSNDAEKIRQLADEMGRQNQKSKLLEKAMISLTETTNLRFEETENRIRLLRDATKTQLENLNASFSDSIKTLDTQMKRFIFNQEITNFAKGAIDKLQTLLLGYLETMNYWDSVFIQLRKGLLPRSLIDTVQLSDLLYSIESSLKNIYKIAFEREDWLNFYNLPFVSYTISEESNGNDSVKWLYIKFKVPIKRFQDQNLFQIITPNSLPIPCLTEDECSIRIESKKSLISFKLDQTVWLLNPKNLKIDFEADATHFSCHRTFDSKLCFTYSSELLRVPSPCTQSIIKWNTTDVVLNCDFEHRSENDYRVIKLNDFQFLLHGKLVGSVSEKCQDEQVVLRDYSQVWAKVLSIKKGCEVFVSKTGQTLVGAFSDPLEGASDLKNVDIFSPLITQISSKLKTPDFKSKELEEFLINKSVSIYDNKLWDVLSESLDNGNITNLNRVSLQITKQLSNDIDALNSRFTTYTFKSNFWSIFAIFGDLLMVSITVMVLFTTLTYSRFFGLIGLGIQIIRPRPIEAFSIIPDIHIFPQITVDVVEDVAFISWLSKVILVIIFISFIVISIKTKIFRTVYLSNHYGICADNGVNRFSLLINIYNKTQFFTHIRVENIYIKVPITVFPEQDINEIKVKNSIMTWSICDTPTIQVNFTDYIHLVGYTKQGRRLRTRNQEVNIPLSKISWTSSPNPVALELINNYDFALITVIKEPEIGHRRLGPARFHGEDEGVEMGSASSPLIN